MPIYRWRSSVDIAVDISKQSYIDSTRRRLLVLFFSDDSLLTPPWSETYSFAETAGEAGLLSRHIISFP